MCQGFKTEFIRDDLYRVITVRNQHTALDQADSGYNDLGTWEYEYDP